MNYIQIDIETSQKGIEAVVSSLLELGITDTVVEDPSDIDDLLNKENDYEWDYIDDSVLNQKNLPPKVTVYLEDGPEERALTEAVKEAMVKLKENEKKGVYGEDIDFGPLSVSVVFSDDSQWKDNWKEYFKPARVGKTVVVKPTWEDYQQKQGEKVIEIDPGMAFGTGTHETTSLCIRLMEDYLKEGENVLDVGCGSGILAIAGALLGASDVLGVEIDPVAVDIANENIKLNKVDDVAKAIYGDLTKGIDYKADLIVANLMADLVMLLSKDVAKHLKPEGRYISSGILVEKAPLVVDTLRSLNFKILEVKKDGMWCAIVAQL